jgi:hypothetical protein
MLTLPPGAGGTSAAYIAPWSAIFGAGEREGITEGGCRSIIVAAPERRPPCPS